MAAYAIQFRRGTTTEHSSFTGLLGEVTVDTTKKTVVVHDGSTSGGFALALESAATSSTTGTFSSNVTVGGTLAVTSTSTFGGDVTVTGDIIPSANITYDLGSSTMMWKDVYIGPGSLYINGKKVIEDDSGTISITTDINEDLKFTTSGTGTLKLISSNGINITGQLGAVSGDLQIGDHMDMNSSLIKQVATPVSTTDAANKAYVDSAASSAVSDGSNAVSGTTGTFSGAVTVAGDLTVNGTTTSVSTTNVTFDDNIFILNSNTTGTPSENSGFEVERGDSLNVQFLWNETDDRWSTGTDTFHAGAMVSATITGDLTGDVTGNIIGNSAGVHTGTVSGNVTGNLTGNSAGVHTGNVIGDVTGNTGGTHTGAVTGNVTGNVTGDLTGNSAGTHTGPVTGNVTGNTSGSAGTVTSIAGHLLDEDNMASDSATKVPSQQSVKAYVTSQLTTQDNTDEMTEGSTNLYYTTARWDTKMAAADTADLSEGTNLYWTTARGQSMFDTRMATQDTADLAEGTNLYFTDERVDDRLNAMLTAGSNITLTYDDAAGTMTITGVEDNFGNNTTSDLTEGTNLYYTTARWDTAFGTSTTTGLTEGTNKYYTDARADARTAISTAANTTAWEAHSDASEAAAIASALATAESKDIARMVTSDAYADASETAAIASAEAKDVARMVTSDAYADASETAAIASAEAKDVARMVTSDAYADASETAAKSFATAADSALQTTLQGNIDTENARIDAIMAGSTADKDTFAEIVSLINTVDVTNDGLLATEIVNRASGDTAAIASALASAESKDVARMVTSDAYADASEAAAIASAESKDVARMVTSDAYADQAESDAIASAESKDGVRATAANAYADAAVSTFEGTLTHFHSAVTDITDDTDLTYTFSELTNARHYSVYLNRMLLRANEYSISGTTVTIVSGVIAVGDELEVNGFSS